MMKNLMQFHVTTKAAYKVVQPGTVLFNVHALATPRQTIVKEQFTVDPPLPTEEFPSATNENRFLRLQTKAATKFKITYRATVETRPVRVELTKIRPLSVAQIVDPKVITYLFPSRYCQSDRLGRLAWTKFGNYLQPHDQVAAIVDWIHTNVEYLRGATSFETSAFDTVTQRAGVCRDFAHLGIALCRALSIPARYFTGYAYQLEPPDFHACFEAYLGGQWFIFDATQLVPLEGLVRIATGRDAADASIATIFGNLRCENLEVSCQLLGGKVKAWTRAESKRFGLALEG